MKNILASVSSTQDRFEEIWKGFIYDLYLGTRMPSRIATEDNDHGGRSGKWKVLCDKYPYFVQSVKAIT